MEDDSTKKLLVCCIMCVRDMDFLPFGQFM